MTDAERPEQMAKYLYGQFLYKFERRKIPWGERDEHTRVTWRRIAEIVLQHEATLLLRLEHAEALVEMIKDWMATDFDNDGLAFIEAAKERLALKEKTK